MKTTLILCTAMLALGGGAMRSAGAEQDVVSASTMSAREGFTRSGTSVLLTRNGVTQKVEKDVTLKNGMKVSADGSVMMPSGEKMELKNNQLLTLNGTFMDVALTQQGTALGASGAPPITKPGEEVGISAHDGVSISGTDAVVTKNGISAKLTDELKLSNGTTIQKDGSVKYPDGTTFTLKADQVLSFDGVLRDVTPKAAVPGAFRGSALGSDAAAPGTPQK